MNIGDFSRLAGVSVKALRLYDAKGVFRPAGRDPLTGYRRYLPSQLPELAALLALRELGVPLKELRAVRASPWKRRRLLEAARDDLEARLEHGARSLGWLEAELAREGAGAHAVVLRRRPGLTVASLRRPLGDAADVVELEAALLARVPAASRGKRRGTLWHRCAGDALPVEAECFVELKAGAPPPAGLEVTPLPPVLAACAFAVDDEVEAHRAFDDVRGWLRLHGHRPGATKRELAWDGVLEVQFPVAEGAGGAGVVASRPWGSTRRR